MVVALIYFKTTPLVYFTSLIEQSFKGI